MARVLLHLTGVGINLLDPAGRLLAASAVILERRHALLAANVANAETPGHVRADLDFQAALWAVLQSTREATSGNGALAGERPWATGAATEPFVTLEETDPDLELEMAEIARNSLRMMAVSTLLSLKLEQLRTAISEGRR